jgi:hypothetical protein
MKISRNSYAYLPGGLLSTVRFSGILIIITNRTLKRNIYIVEKDQTNKSRYIKSRYIDSYYEGAKYF